MRPMSAEYNRATENIRYGARVRLFGPSASSAAERAFRFIRHAMLRQILANELAHDLRWSEILFRTQRFECFLFGRVDQNGQSCGFRFHLGMVQADM